MRPIKFILLLLFGALLLLGIAGGILDIAQLLSMNLSLPTLLVTSLTALVIYLLLVNSELRWQLSRRRDLQDRIDKLAQFRQDGITLLYATTPLPGEFPSWLTRYHSWEDALTAFLKQSFPFAVVEMFSDLGIVPAEQFSHASKDPAIKDEHVHYLRMLARHFRIMERLIEKNTDLLPEAKPGLGELLKWLPGD